MKIQSFRCYKHLLFNCLCQGDTFIGHVYVYITDSINDYHSIAFKCMVRCMSCDKVLRKLVFKVAFSSFIING
jgi:hypothetical protein